MMEILIFKFSVIIILISLLINFISIVFKIPLAKNVLACGIYGFSLKPKGNVKTAMWKFKILGIYNVSRGRDSCGVFIDGNIIKGVDKKKEFTDFIENTILPYPKNNKVVIGHNRASTRGSNIEKNAHPFLINDNLVGVHNGTINNTWEIANKYGFKSIDFDVDSHLLYSIIDAKGLGVLNDYKGFAALAYTYKTQPNILYLYHGASKTTKHGELTEERPLCYVETDDGLFFSSMPESLFAIRDKEDQEVYELGHNVVVQIENGEFTDVEHVVDREETNVGLYLGKGSRAFNKAGAGTTTVNTTKVNFQNGSGGTNNASKNAPSEDESKYPSIIMRETLPEKVTKDYNKNEKFLYYHQNRWWINPRKLVHGPIYLRDRGYITTEEDKESELYFFWEGSMLKDKEAFDVLIEMKASPNSFLNCQSNMNYASHLSRYVRYPITNWLNQGTTLNAYFRNAFYLDDKRINTCSSTPKFSGRNYAFEQGLLTKIHSSHREETLFATEQLAKDELNVFLNGGILSVQGGSAQQSPFREDFPVPVKFRPFSPDIAKEIVDCCGVPYGPRKLSDKCSSENSRDEEYCSEDAGEDINTDNTGSFFYEIIFPDYESALQVIGDLEIEALNKMAKDYLIKMLPLDPDKTEIERLVNEVILEAVKRKCTILSLCTDENERDRLIDYYDEILSETNTEDIALEEDEDPVGNYTKNIKETFEQMEQNSTIDAQAIKDAFGKLKEMRNHADNLSINEDDYSQSAAFMLYNVVDNSMNDLRGIADKFGDVELSNEIKQYIKTPGALK